MDLTEMLKKLAIRVTYDKIIGYDEIQKWPAGIFDELIKMHVLIETVPAKEYKCRDCYWENCDSVELTPLPDKDTGEVFGYFACRMENGVGLVKVDYNRLRQWEILPDRLAQYVSIEADTPETINNVKEQQVTKNTDVVIIDWDRKDDRVKVCKWIHQNWIKRGKPKKADVIRDALRQFGLPDDYYDRIRKQYNIYIKSLN